MFELTQKINQFKRLLLNHRTQNFAQGAALQELAQARLYCKNRQFLEAAELYLDWISLHFSSTSHLILREFFFCLSRIQNHDDSLCIELGLHLLEKESHDKNPEILNIVLQKFIKNQALSQALKTLLHFFNKIPALQSNTSLLITHAEILGLLHQFQEAHGILSMLPNEAQLEVDLQIAKLFLLEAQNSQAFEILQRLFKNFPNDIPLKFQLAQYHLQQNNTSEGEALLTSCLEDIDCFIFYLKYLFQQPHRYHEALRLAEERIQQSLKKDEIQSIQICKTFYHHNYLEGKALFDELLQTHYAPAFIIPILIEFIEFYKEYQDIPYYLNLLKKLNQTHEMPYSLQVLTQQNVSRKQYLHAQHNYPQIHLPDFILHIFQELHHPQYPHEEVFLVGGAVLQLLKNIPFSPHSDLDFICISDRKFFTHFIPSRYIENLYIRDTKRLGGYAVDLKVMPPSQTEEDFLSANTTYRDFTICALFCNSKGVIFDPTGSALDDFQHKRLQTISDAKNTLTQDPVRILRAFKYIARGFKPNAELEAALKDEHVIDFANHQHFNHVLLKECQSFKNKEFIHIMLQYDFFKYLDYCQIPKSIIENQYEYDICQHMINGLIRHKEALSLRIKYNQALHGLEILQNTLQEKIENQAEKVSALNQTHEQLSHSNQTLQQQIFTQQAQLALLKNQNQQQQEKLKRIQILKQQILEKKQKNAKKQEKINQLEEKIIAQYQEEYEKKSNDREFLRNKHRQQLRLANLQNEKYTQQLQILKKNLQTQQTCLHKNKEQWQKNLEKQNLIQQVQDILKPIEKDFEAFEEKPAKNQLRYHEYPNPYALEQMTRVVSCSNLKAYLHAHVAIRGLQLATEYANPFKIDYHFKTFLAFLPQDLKIVYQALIAPILEELPLPPIDNRIPPKAYLDKGKEAYTELRVEEAIYYYHHALTLYASQNKDKLFYDAYIELAKLFVKQHDFLQVDKILQALRRVRNLSSQIQAQIQDIYHTIQTTFQEFKPLASRKYTYQGFMDFWPANMKNLSELSKHTNINMHLNLRKNIYEDIMNHTFYEEEFILAQMEYALLLPTSAAEMQWQIITLYQSQNPDIELLQEYAKFRGIPTEFHYFFEDKNRLMGFRRRILDANLDEYYLIHRDYYPFDSITLHKLYDFKLSSQLFDYICFSLALESIEKACVWEAMFYLQRKNYTPGLSYDYKIKIEEAYLLLPQLSWDCCDAEAWYDYANKHPNNLFLMMFCYYQTLLFNPYHFKALNDLLHLYQTQKNFKMAFKTIALVQHMITYCDTLHNHSSSYGNGQYPEIRTQIHFVIHRINAEHRILKNLLPQDAPENQAFNLKKYNLTKTILWRFYHSTTHDDPLYEIILQQIIMLCITNDDEYSVAHFELARLITKTNPLLAYYHYQEAIETWRGLVFMCMEMPIIFNPYQLNLLRTRQCFMIYQNEIATALEDPKNQNPKFYLEHFKFLLETHWLHLLEEKHIQAFLALETLSSIQQIEAKILLGDYAEAKSLLQQPTNSNISNSQSRLFNFPMTKAGMDVFFTQLWVEWSELIDELKHLKIKEFYINKIIQLGEFLGKKAQVETYQMKLR